MINGSHKVTVFSNQMGSRIFREIFPTLCISVNGMSRKAQTVSSMKTGTLFCSSLCF